MGLCILTEENVSVSSTDNWLGEHFKNWRFDQHILHLHLIHFWIETIQWTSHNIQLKLEFFVQLNNEINVVKLTLKFCLTSKYLDYMTGVECNIKQSIWMQMGKSSSLLPNNCASLLVRRSKWKSNIIVKRWIVALNMSRSTKAVAMKITKIYSAVGATSKISLPNCVQYGLVCLDFIRNIIIIIVVNSMKRIFLLSVFDIWFLYWNDKMVSHFV